ncbi:MAG: hypothetical protein GXP19_07950, partial [Gammaproteobacteria bacterium]|nr:hypothetical protein [Gammaproteobacteria bacterium]
MKYTPGFLLIAAVLAPCAAHAGKLSFVINGKSFHTNSTYQEQNTNINYTCSSSRPQTLDPLNLPPDCRELSRAVSTTNKKYNENNKGYGLIYEFGKNRNYIPYISVGKFRDSFETDAKYISSGLNKRILLNRKLDDLHLEFGGVISVINSPSYANGNLLVTFMPV